MAGLNYGYTYCIRKQKYPFVEGPVFAEKIGKWVVRVKLKGRYTTIKQCNDENEANEFFNGYKNEKAQ